MKLRLVPAPPFVGAREASRWDAQVVGFPYEATASFRGGTRFAPNAIRELSESIETYSPYRDRDLETDLTLVDRGNVLIEEPLALFPEHLNAVRRFCARLKAEASFTLFLGGEHTSTLAFIAEEDVADPRFRLLVLDAHTDLRPSYQGSAFSHAAWARRALEWLGPERLLIAGARSGLREEFALAREHGIWVRTAEEAVERIRDWPEDTRVHLSLDIDVLDLSLVPGTGNPEPCGWKVEDVLRVLEALRPFAVPSADLVEYSPPHDPAGATGILAAFLAREMILAFTRR